MDITLEVLKWVAIVFAAGVVGQLGKSLTLKILAARRGRQEAARRAHPGGQAASSADSGRTALGKGELKLRKKERKAEAKLRKKEREAGR